uniref:Uncharacterized protein n=1 Tax=Tanacetum cinerariifolium TaxID=118510 RepID=A0A699HT76_TANCI|nr:hypothetical protein [Tanacetum cinerariifolium]
MSLKARSSHVATFVSTHPNLAAKQYSRRARIAQSSALPTVADEPASLVRDVSEVEACPTDSGFIADQVRATIAKSSTLPHDSALRVTFPAADEGSMQHTISELTALCTSLQRQYSELLAKFQAQEGEIVKLKERVQVLEDREGVATKQSGDDAPIKGRSINEGEAAAERISNDSEEIARVLTSMDTATVLAGGIDVPTGSGSILTAGPPATVISTGSEVGPNASPIATRRKGKEVIIAKDAEVAWIHAEEELQGMIDSLDKSNETIAKYLQEYQDFALELPLEKRIELISDLVKYQDNYSKVEDFIPMGSKEETERLKRKGLNLEQEQVKKQKSSEEAPEIETSTEEFTEEKVKEMMKLVPVEDIYVQALQVKHPIIEWKEYLSIRPATSDKEMELWVELKRMYEPDPEDQMWTLTQNFMHAHVEWKLYDLSEVHHVTTKDKEIFMLVEKDYPLRKGLALVMISYKLQGRIVGNKMHKAFPLLVRKFPLPEGTSHCLKMNATVRRIEMPLLEVCTAIEEKKKKLSVKDRWQLH